MLQAIPNRVLYVVLFASLFAALTWMIPAAYHAVQPAEHYFEIQDASVAVDENDTSAHDIEAVYWARDDVVVDVRMILEAVEEDGARSEVQAWRFREFVERGSHTTTLHREVSEPLEQGTYVYRLDVTFRVEYNVQKTYSFESGRFSVVTDAESDSKADNQTDAGNPRIQPSITP